MEKTFSIPEKFRHFIAEEFHIYIVLALAILLRFGAFISFAPWEELIEKQFVLQADAAMYHDHALIILSGEYPFSDRVSPGFPIIIATVYSILGVKPWLVLILNIVLNVTCIYLVYRLGVNLFREKIAILASFFLAIDVHQIVFTQTLLTDTIFTLLIMLCMLSIVKNYKENSLLFLVSAGASLAIAVLIRPIGVYFYLFVTAFLLLLQIGHLDRRLMKSIVFVFVYFLILSPVIGLNYAKYEHFGVSRLGGLNFLYVNAMSVYEIQGGKSHEESIEMVNRSVQKYGGDSIINPNEKEKLYYKVGYQIIRENLVAYLTNHVNGCINIYTSLSTYNIARVLRVENNLLGDKFFGYPVYSQIGSFIERKTPLMFFLGTMLAMLLAFQYLSAIMGMAYLIKRRMIFELAVLITPIFYLTIVAGVVGNARFKLPISPFLLILTAYGIRSFLDYRSYQK